MGVPEGFCIKGDRGNSMNNLHDCLVTHFTNPLKLSGEYYITVHQFGWFTHDLLCYVVKEKNGTIYHKILIDSRIYHRFEWAFNDITKRPLWLGKFELYVR